MQHLWWTKIENLIKQLCSWRWSNKQHMQLIKCKSSGWNPPFGNSCPLILLVLYLVMWDVTPGGSWTLALCHISPALLCFVVIFSYRWDPRLSFRLENGHFFSFKTEKYAFFPLKEVYWFSFGNHWLYTALPIATGALIFFFLIFTLFLLLGSKSGGQFLNVNCSPKKQLKQSGTGSSMEVYQ